MIIDPALKLSIRNPSFQSRPDGPVQELTLKLRCKPVQSQSTSVKNWIKIVATLTKRIGFFPSADRLNGVLIHDRSLSRCANWSNSSFEANLTNGCQHLVSFTLKIQQSTFRRTILQTSSVISVQSQLRKIMYGPVQSSRTGFGPVQFSSVRAK